MTKKVWLVLLAVVLVLGLGLLGCKGDGSPGGGPGDELPWALDESDFSLKIAKNEYSNDKDNKKGNQGKVNFNTAGLGIPKADDKFTLAFTGFSDETGAKKDDVALSIALVDTSVAAGYWKVIGEWNAEVTGNDKGYANIADVEKYEVFEFEGTLTVKTAPDATSPSDICLVFAMEAQPWANQATLYFKPYSFTKN